MQANLMRVLFPLLSTNDYLIIKGTMGRGDLLLENSMGKDARKTKGVKEI